MATIIIKDLLENVELDRQAMRAIAGGARTRGHQPVPRHTLFRSTRIVNYPSDFIRNPSAAKSTSAE